MAYYTVENFVTFLRFSYCRLIFKRLHDIHLLLHYAHKYFHIPPRQLLVLMRMTRSRFGLSILQFSTNRFFISSRNSLPYNTTHRVRLSFLQLRTMIFHLVHLHFRPSAFRVRFNGNAVVSSDIIEYTVFNYHCPLLIPDRSLSILGTVTGNFNPTHR